MKKQEFVLYGKLLSDIKQRVRQGQQRAAMSANATMILTYWDIGQMIAERQEAEGWGASVIPRLAVDLKNELPEEKGFSQLNLGNMVRFFREYGVPTILQHAAAKLGSLEIGTNIEDPEAGSFLQHSIARSKSWDSEVGKLAEADFGDDRKTFEMSRTIIQRRKQETRP